MILTDSVNIAPDPQKIVTNKSAPVEHPHKTTDLTEVLDKSLNFKFQSGLSPYVKLAP